MPWVLGDSFKHTHKADTPAKKKQWSTVANAARESGKSDAASIRIANAAVKKHPSKTVAKKKSAHKPK